MGFLDGRNEYLVSVVTPGRVGINPKSVKKLREEYDQIVQTISVRAEARRRTIAYLRDHFAPHLQNDDLNALIQHFESHEYVPDNVPEADESDPS